ncbi:MAG: ABC transporter permease [candidate division Zixibacteria bacterium]|nr:ABC transporter permease [candidate division Zixibacteria bacterium]
MQFFESVGIALRSLISNKLRSILTLIGMIIGVMTVIAVVSIIAGMNKYVADRISSLGSSTFFVDKFGAIVTDEEFHEALKRKDLTMEDMEAIKENCPLCWKVGARQFTTRKVKYKKDYISDIAVVGATSNFSEIMEFNVENGRSHSDFEDEHNRRVVLIGWEIADKLFSSQDPIGKNIKIGDYYFKVIGVAGKRGNFLGQSQDNFVLIPITTFNKLFGSNQFLLIYVRVEDFSTMQQAQDQARLILRTRRDVQYDKPDDFDISTAESIMNIYRTFTATAFLVMIGISSIALVVGGIVIMNIMLVSVTERTREIGVRKAVGAKKKNILWQFLVEAVTLSLVGGVIGIILGAMIAKIVDIASPLPAAIELWSVIAGVIIATSVGLFFGIFPAMKAAKLDPIACLRYE